ncbi:urease subunit gamma [Herbaspirillum rhizosphaerae]|uniref:urease subunit gamma n=1 Tax=Herbaspirillum rhizosphaerae TaxID=346179 RepID=UPI00067B577E|nr:urease subunit gamma [Herbaspirillum rhizosphaerae]
MSDIGYGQAFMDTALAAIIARKRLERGVKLNLVEAEALIRDFIHEGARDGRSVAELMAASAGVLTRDQVMEGVADMLTPITTVGSFPTGLHPVTVWNPIR